MPSKFEFNKGKMVPYPSGAIVPDRDLGERPALECIHLGIEFGGLKAVDDFSLTIGKTEIAGLIGPNGAGKTTVFNLLTKVYQPTHGTILLDGEDTSGKSVYQVNRMGIARTFQNIRLFNTMTVEDNVKVGLHNQERYSGFEGVLRLPTYWKHEKAAHERAVGKVAGGIVTGGAVVAAVVAQPEIVGLRDLVLAHAVAQRAALPEGVVHANGGGERFGAVGFERFFRAGSGGEGEHDAPRRIRTAGDHVVHLLAVGFDAGGECLCQRVRRGS